VLALFSHDKTKPLARRSAGSLTLARDRVGLLADVTLSDTVSYAADTLDIIRRGDAVGASFGFIAMADSWEMRANGPHRILLDIELHEISIAVAFPAYPSTKFYVRGASARGGSAHTSIGRSRREVEALLALSRGRTFTNRQHGVNHEESCERMAPVWLQTRR